MTTMVNDLPTSHLPTHEQKIFVSKRHFNLLNVMTRLTAVSI